MMAPITDVKEKVWFLESVRGMIGSTAVDSHFMKRMVVSNPLPS